MISFIAALEKNKDKMDFKGKHVKKISFQIVISKSTALPQKLHYSSCLTNDKHVYNMLAVS